MIRALVILLAVYHLANFGSRVRWPYLWDKLVFSLSWRGHDFVRLPVLAERRQAFTSMPDQSSRAVAEAGGILRYFLGSTRQDIFRKMNSTRERLYWTEELNWSQPLTKQEIRKRFSDRLNSIPYPNTLLIPIPTKISVENGDATAVANYRALVRTLKKETINLQDRYKSSTQFFLPFDTHWSLLGRAVAAQGFNPNAKIVSKGFRPDANKDLLTLLLLPKWFQGFWPTFQNQEPVFDIENDCPANAPGRVFLIGSSYSALERGTPYAFSSMMEKATCKKVIDLSVAASKTLEPLEKFLATAPALGESDLLVIEFAVRFAW